ncbi:MAG: DUF362 domain-containing protein [Thermoproteota archaeon]
MSKSYTVGISEVDNDNYVEAMSKLFDMIDAFNLLKGKKKILIKPNFADTDRDLPKRNGDQTSLEALEAIIRLINYHVKPEELIIGEGSATPTWKAYFNYGVYEMAVKHNVRLVDFNNDEVIRSSPKNGFFLREVLLPRTIFEVDAILSVPALKVWSATAVSLSIKNYAGGILPSYWYHRFHRTQGLCNVTNWRENPQFNPDFEYGQSKTLAAGMVDILLVAPKPVISIIDALRCMHLKSRVGEFEFNTNSIQVDRRNLFIGGENIVAVDSVGTSAMGIDPQKVLHLEMASQKELGTNDASKISTKGESLENIRFKVNPPFSMKEILYK